MDQACHYVRCYVVAIQWDEIGGPSGQFSNPKIIQVNNLRLYQENDKKYIFIIFQTLHNILFIIYTMIKIFNRLKWYPESAIVIQGFYSKSSSYQFNLAGSLTNIRVSVADNEQCSVNFINLLIGVFFCSPIILQDIT